jgi:hypothetical protein
MDDTCRRALNPITEQAKYSENQQVCLHYKLFDLLGESRASR